jgi:hypothetical protein
MRKKAICIICKNQELFLSLKRALKTYFPNTCYYFYDTEIIEKDNFDNMYCPSFKKEGVLIAFFIHDEENERISQAIKYMRIKKGNRFPLLYCSFLNEKELNERYGIFGFGISMNKYKSSNAYFTIPFELTTLKKAISDSTPLDDENYGFFIERFSGRYIDLYNNEIKPLLEKLQQTIFNSSEYFSITNRIEPLIENTVKITRKTCHNPVPGDQDKIPLGQRLINAIEGLKSNPDEVKKLDFLLNKWLELVTNKSFE